MPKPSRKPQYAKAFTLFCDGLALGEISQATGLSEVNLADCAHSQNWEKRRGLLLGHRATTAAETRIQAQIAVDSTLVNATQSAAATLAQAYVRLIEEASALPTRPFVEPSGEKPSENEVYRQSRAMIQAKTETMKLATSGLRELIETAQNIGLLKVDRGGKTPNGSDDRDKPIDLAKLTQLNIAIVQATNGANGAAGQPARVVAQLSEPTAERASASGELVNVTPAS